ncbi:hypothetical protein LS71_002265 [Helicobacter jaachi]|uniref:Campylobacter invasion antigen D C-terminal domain-containing protein n=1 Tax=Helicobacter jaachi TaxID=1677920 RepID=A0A4U8TCB6_9HELI|nr:hypothetical protein [Helicobacter jaachi]TLD97591.1 hypothetical protein LS71_002265 [Helicobacter jaachi]
MDLKDLILETLNELSPSDTPKEANAAPLHINHSGNITPITPAQLSNIQRVNKSHEALREECEFLEMLQERLLVLFEGLSVAQNKNIESALNITINFLEYELSIIQERLDDIRG